MDERSLVVISGPLQEAGLRMLQERFAVRLRGDSPLEEAVVGASAIVADISDTVSSSVIDAAGAGLRLIAQHSVGFENIDLEYARSKAVEVSHVPGLVVAHSVAEHTLGLALSVARIGNPVRRLYGGTVGIIGCGEIGKAFAALCHAGLKMRVLYADPERNLEAERILGAHKVDLETVLTNSDVISLHLPLSANTRHLLGNKELELIKPDAILLNTSRADLIDPDALLMCLNKGHIWGAGLDLRELDARIATHERAVYTPHLGASAEQVRVRMAESVAKNVIAALSGSTPPNLV